MLLLILFQLNLSWFFIVKSATRPITCRKNTRKECHVTKHKFEYKKNETEIKLYLFVFLIELKNITPTLEVVDNKSGEQATEVKKTNKRAKWHLGIRSQSKPQDIMNEVFKAMKACNMVSQL